MDELIMVITSEELEMTDDERIKRIEKIHLEMQDDSDFLQSFGNSVTMLWKQRFRDQSEIKISRKLGGLNQ